jgi:serine/threonine protein kinase/Tfp pilus assembly protein PilF
MASSDTAAAPSGSSLTDRLAEEMGRRWRAGERPVVEDYLALYPELLARPRAAVELIFEELCLRQEFAEAAASTDVLRRFPQWREQLQLVVECHRLLEADTSAERYPAVGECLAGFRLLGELGRGAQGRVYLATQSDLGDRPVVVKLTPRSGREHLSLARLQHTNIVPLYSATDELAWDLRALCMPYFGGITLARLLASLEPVRPAQRAGAHLVEALQQAQAAALIPMPAAGPVCQFLARASYTRAVCWVGACLADALHYTHERGLVHLDLKPSNVLLAADGQPMLLDLHLARGPIPAGAPAPAWLGGTLAYMAPEQRLALAAVREGRAVATAVDGRADVYSLGLLLCETLGGALPPPGRTTGRWLRARNPHVSTGLADILGKCLARDPSERYAHAAALAADLRCHISDLPLRGVVNRSPLERWRKWQRRRPERPALVALALCALVAVGLALAYVGQVANKARLALDEGQKHFQRRDYEGARDSWQRGLTMVENLPFQGDLAVELRGGLARVERAEVAQQLHGFVEQVRVLYGADDQCTADVRAVEARCRTFWQKRYLISRRLATEDLSAEREQIQADVLDLAVLWTNLRVRLAGAGGASEALEQALEVYDEAEKVFGPSCVLNCERRASEAALGRANTPPKPAPAPRTAWEHYAVGRARFRGGECEAANAQFERALALEPHALWAHFYKGACAFRQAKYEDAVLAFSACAVLAPERAWCYYNRGLAYDAMGRTERALEDYDRALEREPALTVAALSRCMCHHRAGRYTEALDDLRLAERGGADRVVVAYERALIHLARGDRRAALDSLDHVLKLDANHEQARALAHKLRQP